LREKEVFWRRIIRAAARLAFMAALQLLAPAIPAWDESFSLAQDKPRETQGA
jgi:hypothetical protein